MSDSRPTPQEGDVTESVVVSNAAIESATAVDNEVLSALESANDVDDVGGEYLNNAPLSTKHNSRISDSELLALNPDEITSAGLYLRYYRLKANMSVQQVAPLLKATVRTIHEVEDDLLLNRAYIPYGRSVIRRYAIAMKVNPFYVIDLYINSISEDITIIQQEEEKTDRQMNRNWLLIVLMILIATAGYFVFSAKEKDEQVSGNIANTNSQVAVEVSQPLVTDKIVIKEEPQEQVVIEDPNNTKTVEVKVVDPNTARATAQEQALAQQAAKENNALDEHLKQPNSLDLPQEVILSSTNSESAAPIDLNAANKAPAVVESPRAHESIIINETTLGANAQVAAQQVTANKEAVASKSKAQEDNVAVESKKAPALEPQKTELEPELSANLKDVSAKVKIINREGIASLNSAEIVVNQKVALKVIDGQNKVLSSGVYESGKTLKITGIPPLKVQLSDSKAVTILYKGGTVVIPKGKQVSLELPMR